MTVIPALTEIDESPLAVKLATYAHIVGIDECNLFGVNHGDVASQCDPIWNLTQRTQITRYLLEAQREIEAVTGFYLTPTYTVGEQRPYRFPLVANWGKIIACGIKATIVIASGEAVDYTTDPCIIGPVATSVLDIAEIQVFHPGTTIPIYPSKITLAGGNVTIEIPRCRMVEIAAQDSPVNGWDYNDVPPSASSPFVATVDLVREYTDETFGATLVYPHRSTDSCSCACACRCEEHTTSACTWIRKTETSVIDLMKATYAGGKWTPTCCSFCYPIRPEYARVHYLSGMNPTTLQAEDAIIRLAHSKMATQPCGCELALQVWARDRNIPESPSVERLNCIWGLSDGAWIAFKFASAMKMWRSGVL